MVKTSRQKSPWTVAEREAWAPPADVTVSQWAGADRYIGDYSAESGPWENTRAPYLVDIMDAYSDPEVEEITIVGPAQSGKTEAVFNMIGWTIDIDPAPSMYVVARDSDANTIGDDRLWPMFSRDCPAIADHLSGSPRDYSKGTSFTFDRMNLYFGSAQSAPSLSMKPVKNVFLDETDKYPAKIGDEGSPAKLAKRRTVTFANSKAVYLCTITVVDGFINRSYERSNKMIRMVPCPCCGEYIRLIFSQLKVDPPDLRDTDLIIINECVYYECQLCGGRFDESMKNDIDLLGRWVPAGCKVTRDGVIIGKPKKTKRHSGFWIDGMLSPWLLWYILIADWFSLHDAPGGLNPQDLREYLNQALAQVWKEQAKEVDFKVLKSKRNDLLRGAVPIGAVGLTVGADYHEKDTGEISIAYEVRAWLPGLHDFVIDSGWVDSWLSFETAVIFKSFPWADGDCEEIEMAVSTIFIDSGYYPDEIYEFCRKWPNLCYPTKGQQTMTGKLAFRKLDKVLSDAEDLKRRKKAPKYKGMLLIKINTDYFKSAVTSRAERPAGEYNSTEFYHDCPDEYFRHLTNEHKKENKVKGETKFIWEPVTKSAPTHFLDTAVGASAAGYWRKVHELGIPRPKESAAAARRRAIAAAKRKNTPQPKKPDSSFLDNIPKIEI